MSQLIATNFRVLSQLNYARSIVNAPCSFRLFTNPVTLTPGTSLSQLIEATFPGYTRLATTGKFGVPLKVTDGRYQSSATPFQITCTGDSAEEVQGWSISTGPTLLYAAKFPAPIPALNGTLFNVQISLVEASLSLCTC